MTLVDSSFSASDCYISKNVSRGVRGYGRCVIALSHCDISGNGVSPAVSIDEKQDLSHAGEDAIICIRDSVGDVVSDPPSMKWAGAENNTTSYTLNGEQITINAIIGQSLEVDLLCYALYLVVILIIMVCSSTGLPMTHGTPEK